MTIQQLIAKLNEKAKTVNKRAQRSITSVCDRLEFFSVGLQQKEKLDVAIAEAELWLLAS